MSDATFNKQRAEALAQWCREAMNSCASLFLAGRVIATKLGGTYNKGHAEFGFWVPELLERRVPDHDIAIEILEPTADIDFATSRQTIAFRRTRFPVIRHDGFVFSVVDGLTAGTRDTFGAFYALSWRDEEGQWTRILDPLAASLPFGAFSPAELYDTDSMQAGRGDLDYYRDMAKGSKAGEAAKLSACASILQIHIPTATAGGTVASLTEHFEFLAQRIRRDLPLEPKDRLLLGYDAIQFLPLEPTTVYEVGAPFWEQPQTDDNDSETVDVVLRRPNTTNWGYDVVTSGMAAINPALLETGRPDELVDLVATLHNFPNGGKRVIFDVVYGHCDNQGLDLLPHHYFLGPNMYGQNINYRNPIVRSVLLEMQRRKVNYGADAVRVDGAQDFQWYDQKSNTMLHDDDYLQLMADVVQDVGGTSYRPWFIFEDGRPWPDEDWELSSTYRAVIESQRDDDVFQWGPLTFAHNTPFIYGFWLSKWWRIREIMQHGANWISGCANHDTLRRGTQLSTKLNVNSRLGSTRMEILDKAYDNPAINLLTYAALPGVPMDFLNASARASWGFIRNQDDRWGVKIVAEEAISLTWQVDAYAYSGPAAFTRLKKLGFAQRDDLGRFLEFLPALVDVTGYDLDVISKLLSEVDPPLVGPEKITPDTLKQIARAWMNDMHDFCNVSLYETALDVEQTIFNLELRKFRRARPWLRNNIGEGEIIDYRRPVDGTVLLYALRVGPDGEQILMVAHMEGLPLKQFDPLSLPIQGLSRDGWTLRLRAPAIDKAYRGGPVDINDSDGLLFTRGGAD